MAGGYLALWVEPVCRRTFGLTLLSVSTYDERDETKGNRCYSSDSLQ
jgi:hypothetical protein